jgi:hypothetical protein
MPGPSTGFSGCFVQIDIGISLCASSVTAQADRIQKPEFRMACEYASNSLLTSSSF